MKKYLETSKYNRRLNEVLESGNREEIANFFDENYTILIDKTFKKQSNCDVTNDFPMPPASIKIAL